MITATEIPGTDVVQLDLESTGHGDGLDAASMAAVRKLVEDVAARRGRVRLLGVIGRIGHVSIGGLREDLKTIRTVGRIDRVAVVTDSTWMRVAAKAEAKVLGFELRGYPAKDVEDARAWLLE